MANGPDNRGKRLGSKVQFFGIGADARTLGLSTSYLWRCLTGRITCEKIVSDYWELKKDQARRFLSKPAQIHRVRAQSGPQCKVNP